MLGTNMQQATFCIIALCLDKDHTYSFQVVTIWVKLYNVNRRRDFWFSRFWFNSD